MDTVSRWLVPAVLAAGLGTVALSPAPAYAQSGDDLVRVLVDVADVVLRGGTPYYRHGDYGYDDRLIVGRDRFGRPVYYRQMPRQFVDDYRYRDMPRQQQVRCNSNGKCKVTYYDPRYDRRYNRYDNKYYGYDRRRWRDD
ncbi:MAG: hypothetical protein ACREPE_13630 [Lysobacter sp.]